MRVDVSPARSEQAKTLVDKATVLLVRLELMLQHLANPIVCCVRWAKPPMRPVARFARSAVAVPTVISLA